MASEQDEQDKFEEAQLFGLEAYFQQNSHRLNTRVPVPPRLARFLECVADWQTSATRGATIHKTEKLPEDWFKYRCIEFISKTGTDQDPEHLCAQIRRILTAAPAQIQDSLLSLLGYDDMDFLMELVSRRDEILASGGKPTLVRLDRDNTSEAQNIDMMYGKRKAILKARDDVPENDLVLDATFLRDQRVNLYPSRPLELLANQDRSAPRYPHIYDDVVYNRSSTSISISGYTLALPLGSERRDTGEFEEIKLPMPDSHHSLPRIDLVKVGDMESWTRPVYESYKTLNRIQTIVYPTAFGTNENMLVCAPTGAGKTDVALLTVLSTIRQYITNAEELVDHPNKLAKIDKSQFKIVYVAPMKALAAEITAKFSNRLKGLGLKVREWTGDMQLSQSEVDSTQMLVVTPEKWDVVTRKVATSSDLNVKLLILDEVHLLQDERGAVIESIVARTLRQVESSQSLIRIVGLSATLPNYIDVAEFLRVNPNKGLFFFGNAYRPVPLQQSFVGIKGKSQIALERYTRVTYDKAVKVLQEDRQVMVFVHSRKDTVRTGRSLVELAMENAEVGLFEANDETKGTASYQDMLRQLSKSRNREMRELVEKGVGIHHAGMLRSDRLFVEKHFALGHIRLLVCTSTLAWGVNLPAYNVIIKGTQVFDSEKGAFVDLSILDVLQIFGRAGRPQFEPNGLATIITSHDKLSHYVSRMATQLPIESKFSGSLIDNLNAEISSTGTVTTVHEAIQWLGYTYMYIRMRKNPLVYGLRDWDPLLDPNLIQFRRDMIVRAVKELEKSQMVTYNEATNMLAPKQVGRIASQYYITWESIVIFNESLGSQCSEADVISILACCKELAGIKLRDNEVDELKRLADSGACPCEVKFGPEHEIGKKSILIQAYISRYQLDDFSLISDSGYIMQNIPRILRALFEYSLVRCWASTTYTILSLCKSVEKRVWSYEHPLLQFGLAIQQQDAHAKPLLSMDILRKLEQLPEASKSIEAMKEMSLAELGDLVRNNKWGESIHQCLMWLPNLQLDVRILPITRSVFRVDVSIHADFVWNKRVHGSVETFWLWIEDSESSEIYASQYLVLKATDVEAQVLSFMIPVKDPPPSQIYVNVISDRWASCENVEAVSITSRILPETASPHTDLLNLTPLSVNAVRSARLEAYFGRKFQHFNPIQTQVFHSLFNTKFNMLIGAPTGSGKTACAELAMFACWNAQPSAKVVYIAPLKALVRERMDDWARSLQSIGRSVVELTGDATPDSRSIHSADLIITTPEKWDGISRNWKQRSYVKSVALIVMDEIHLLGGDRGPTLEVIVSRMNYISFCKKEKIRLVGLSTALSNALDLASWLDVHPTAGFFNFRHSVRPVPLEIYIDGFQGRHYCPRMATMNKPIFNSILTHSEGKPVLVFVSSRRQTRLTSNDLITLCFNNSSSPRQFLKIPVEEMERICDTRIVDSSLKMSLTFGIGLHHAGLPASDRSVVEELFLAQKIQVLIATSTVAWGVNFPAHLVIVKGTEFFDAKSKKYVDYPITDVLQMIGRAGRPQFDTTAIAHLLVYDQKKSFFKKFLHEPFPVESSLHLAHHLTNHINAEIVSETIKAPQDAIEYLTWTYFYRRLRLNPNYYGLEFGDKQRDPRLPVSVSDLTQRDVNRYLSELVEKTLAELAKSSCLVLGDRGAIAPSPFGVIASFYYLSHLTVRLFTAQINATSDHRSLLGMISCATEYDELPVRHNEDNMNSDLAKKVRFDSFSGTTEKPDFNSPNFKTFLLLQTHFSRFTVDMLPVSDYGTDTKSVLDQTIRILQSLTDVCAELDVLGTTLRAIQLMQCVKSGCWWDSDPLQVYDVRPEGKVKTLPQLIALANRGQTRSSSTALTHLPVATIKVILANSAIVEKSVVEVSSDSVSLEVDLDIYRASEKHNSREEIAAYTPRYHKPQFEGWFIVVGCLETDSVLAVKRVSSKPSAKIKVDVKVPEGLCELSVFVTSDCYVGLDQQLNFFLNKT